MEAQEHYINQALEGLKDFQHASVEVLYQRMYREKQSRMLLADEVGLGKTVVAKGLIASVLRERKANGLHSPFKVTYICSNQVIARENLRKLNLFPAGFDTIEEVNRITGLAWQPKKKRKQRKDVSRLSLNVLTPGTSFNTTGSAGNFYERRAIYEAIRRSGIFSGQEEAIKWVLRGTVRNITSFRQRMDHVQNDPLREGLVDRYLADLRQTSLKTKHPKLRELIGANTDISLFEALERLTRQFSEARWKAYASECYSLAWELRRRFIECCLPFVDADLFILDEFQRFSELIDENCEEEHALLARRIFDQKDESRILMLSATPFKPFTGYLEAANGEDHYRDLRRVLQFVLGSDTHLAEYEQHRRALHHQLIQLREGEAKTIEPTHRERVESVLRSVICRTERQSVATKPGALILDKWKETTPRCTEADVRNFLQADRLALSLREAGARIPKPVEYCKSAPFPLSFLDNYRFKDELRRLRGHSSVSPTLAGSTDAWLDLSKIDTYNWSLDSEAPPHSRLQEVVDAAIGESGAKLLWVPPSLPYYPLEDAFADSEGFSKTLVFSSWIMVPRMLSALLSYEVERRTIGNPDTQTRQEPDRRSYFPKGGDRKRHPAPLLRFSRSESRESVRLANMSNFTLLYPSPTLSKIVDPLEALKGAYTLDELRRNAAERIRNVLEELDTAQFVQPGGESERWYWAAPLLLDQKDSSIAAVIRKWLSKEHHTKPDNENKKSEDESSIKRAHFARLAECFENPDAIGLGAVPDDLPEILADVALGSPAVVALRSLQRMFRERTLQDQVTGAARAADRFLTLFNKPESIAAVRLSENHRWYWQMVTDYCASGCLQGVLDEYFHLLRGQNVDGIGAVSQLEEAVTLNASVLKVDSLESFISGSSKKMRCHYAVEFGSQRVESESGEKRASNIRQVFNSPFRPFVLSTTSIGQEGLDFHLYCRRIVHWNLPNNPVDLEQREGRINRFKGLAIRQQIAARYKDSPILNDVETDLWEALFDHAERVNNLTEGSCDLVPYWHIDPINDCRIERIIPLYPFSEDQTRLKRLLQTLTIYRLAFGQPRQVELVDHLLARDFSDEEVQVILDRLTINLSPIRYLNSNGACRL